MDDDQEMLNPLQELTTNLTKQFVSQMVRESTKQAIRKQGIKLSQSQFHKFQEKITHLSDKQKLETMKEPLQEVKETLTTIPLDDKSFDKISDTLSHGFETKMAVGLAFQVKVGIIAAILGILIIGGLFLFLTGNTGVISNQLVLGTSGNETTICSVCNGTGNVTCPVCKGIVNVNAISKIPDTPENPNPCSTDTNPKSKCENCGGTGKVLCTNCKGDGRINLGDPGYGK